MELTEVERRLKVLFVEFQTSLRNLREELGEKHPKTRKRQKLLSIISAAAEHANESFERVGLSAEGPENQI